MKQTPTKLVFDKVVRDGKVAVLYSPGFGAGWSTWCGDEYKQFALFHPALVKWVDDGKVDDLEEILNSILGRNYFYSGGARDLEIYWMHMDDCFTVEEYDGSESIIVLGPQTYNVASADKVVFEFIKDEFDV